MFIYYKLVLNSGHTAKILRGRARINMGRTVLEEEGRGCQNMTSIVYKFNVCRCKSIYSTLKIKCYLIFNENPYF